MFKKILYALLFIIIFVVLDIALCFVYPNVSSLKKENPGKTAFMEIREHQWKSKGLDKTISQKWVSINAVSPYLIKAVIIAEDDKFWRHEGFDYAAMKKAFENDLKKKKFKAGGSTISQQLAKNLYLSPSKDPIRKIKEAIYTWRLERNLSKKRIMEIYLNVAEWGDGIFGIQAAANHYYGTNASGLGPEESARLASVLPNPIRLSPVGKSRYVANRSAIILSIMVRRGIVIPEYEDVMNAPEEQAGPEDNSLTTQANTSGTAPPPSTANTSGITESQLETRPQKDAQGSAVNENNASLKSQEENMDNPENNGK